MKTINIKIPILFFYFIAFASCGQAQGVEKLSSDEVSAEEIKLGKSFTTAFYDALSKGSTYAFTKENSTEIMVRANEVDDVPEANGNKSIQLAFGCTEKGSFAQNPCTC